MAYLKSTQVKVYPSAYRGTDTEGNLYNPESQLNTEYNITNLQANDSYRSYVVSWKDSILKCVIHGYYFELTLDTTTINGFTSTIWASINIQAANTVDTTNTKYAAYTLVSYTQDAVGIPSKLDDKDSGNFIGLNLTEEKPTSGATATLCILHKTSVGNWQVPDSSWCIIDTTQILDNGVDGPISESFTTNNISTTTLNVSGETTTQGNVIVQGDLEVGGSTTFKDTLNVAGPTTLEASLELTQGGITSRGDITSTFGNIISKNNVEAHEKVISPIIETKYITATDNNGTIGSETTPFKNIYVNTLVASTINGKFVGNLDVTRVESSEVGPNLKGQYVAYVELSFNAQGNSYKISVSGLVDLQSGITTIPVNYLLSHTEETDSTDKQKNATRCTDIRAEGYVRIFQSQSQLPYGVKCNYSLYIYEYKDVRRDMGTSQYSQLTWWVQRTLKETLTGSDLVYYIHIQG